MAMGRFILEGRQLQKEGQLLKVGQLQKECQLQTADNKSHLLRTRIFGKAQFLNAALRLLPLLAKLGLTLYMGRYFSLADIGVYGLVFGAVIILLSFLGQCFSYVVMRDIVSVPPFVALHKMRDQALLYAANCLILIAAAAFVIVAGLSPIAPKIVGFTVLLTILEAYADAIYMNMNSLNQQVRASVFYFVRAGLWIIPVVLLGWYDPAWRKVDVILFAWAAGAFISLLAGLWFWREMPWRQAMQMPIDWPWLRNGLKKSSLVWLGSMGLAGGGYVDRFIVEYFLSLHDAGIVAFYASFSNALPTLMQSGILAFTYPRLIAAHRKGHKAEFAREVRKALWQVAVSGGTIALALAIGVPLLGYYVGRPELANSALTLWLMLIGATIQSIGGAFYYVLYARHQDRALWLGNLLFLVPAAGGNALLVSLIGLPGTGIAAIAAASFLLLWRFNHARQYERQLEE